jgi:hypothetical protein
VNSGVQGFNFVNCYTRLVLLATRKGFYIFMFIEVLLVSDIETMCKLQVSPDVIKELCSGGTQECGTSKQHEGVEVCSAHE